MIKIGITGSLASGKSTVSKLMSKNKYPLFSADKEVKSLYKNNYFVKSLKKKFKLKNNVKVKKQIKSLIMKNNNNLRKLELLIHPFVRNQMKKFIKLKRKNKIIFLEIPLLIESKLMKYFDDIYFVNATTSNRLSRYLKRGGSKKVFKILNMRQLNTKLKLKYSDYVINNNSSLTILKKNVKNIIKKYE